MPQRPSTFFPSPPLLHPWPPAQPQPAQTLAAGCTRRVTMTTSICAAQGIRHNVLPWEGVAPLVLLLSSSCLGIRVGAKEAMSASKGAESISGKYRYSERASSYTDVIQAVCSQRNPFATGLQGSMGGSSPGQSVLSAAGLRSEISQPPSHLCGCALELPLAPQPSA